MGTSIVKTGQILGMDYKLMLLDDKYTLYILLPLITEHTEQNDKEAEFALRSFDNLKEAEDFVMKLENEMKEDLESSRENK